MLKIASIRLRVACKSDSGEGRRTCLALKKKERREKREKKKKKRETGMRRDEENTGIETNTRLSFYQWINIEVSLEQ